MNEREKFRVFKSKTYTFGKIYILLAGIVVFFLIDPSENLIRWGMLGICVFAWIYYMLNTTAMLYLDRNGIECRRPLKKPITMEWSRVQCSGRMRKTVYMAEHEFCWFSTKSVSKDKLTGRIFAPLSDDFLYASATPELEAAIKKFSRLHIPEGKTPDRPADKRSDLNKKYSKLIGADIAAAVLTAAVYMMRQHIPTLWLPLMLVCSSLCVILTAVLVYKRKL